MTHPMGWPHVDGKCCTCGAMREKPKPCTCGPDEGCGDPCVQEPECQHPNKYNYGFASGPPAIRYFYCSACKAKWETAEGPEEPPLTPEEEEEAPEDCPHCPDGHQDPQSGSQPWSAWVATDRDGDGQPMQISVARSAGAHVAESDAQWVRERLNAPREQLPLDHPLRRECRCNEAGVCKNCAERPSVSALPPPQPDRRPPYAVAYSVQGHLYEVALSGDATVKAVDGALVIQHHLGPVAGIVQVLPVINEES